MRVIWKRTLVFLSICLVFVLTGFVLSIGTTTVQVEAITDGKMTLEQAESGFVSRGDKNLLLSGGTWVNETPVGFITENEWLYHIALQDSVYNMRMDFASGVECICNEDYYNKLVIKGYIASGSTNDIVLLLMDGNTQVHAPYFPVVSTDGQITTLTFYFLGDTRANNIIVFRKPDASIEMYVEEIDFYTETYDRSAVMNTSVTQIIMPKLCDVYDYNYGGQCESIIIIDRGRVAVIDAGDAGNSTRTTDASKFILTNTLYGLGVTKIDVLILSHPHGDHYGAMSYLMSHFDIGAFVYKQGDYENKATGSTTMQSAIDTLISIAEAKVNSDSSSVNLVNVDFGEELILFDRDGDGIVDVSDNDSYFKFYYNKRIFEEGESADGNYFSIVSTFTVGNTGVLYAPGDYADEYTDYYANVYEEDVLNAASKFLIYQPAHHGQSTPYNSAAIISKIAPKYILICNTEENYTSKAMYAGTISRIETYAGDADTYFADGGAVFTFDVSSKTITADDSYKHWQGAFEMVNGASVKFAGENSGIRFRVRMGEGVFREIYDNDDVSLKFIITSKALYEAKRDGDGEYINITKKQVIDVDEDKYYTEGNYYFYNGCLTRLLANNRNVYLVAIAAKYNSSTGDYSYASINDVGAIGSMYDTLNQALLSTRKDYIPSIMDADNTFSTWFGTADYPVLIEYQSNYNDFVNKINDGADISSVYVTIGPDVATSGDDVAELEEGKTLPGNTVYYYNVEFYNESVKVKTQRVQSGSSANAPTVSKDGNAQYCYSFAAWLDENDVEADLTHVTSNMTVYASYTQTLNSYTVTWKNYDDSELYTETVNYGEMPEYVGTPEKTSTTLYKYTFVGWTPAVSSVSGDITYTATYTENYKNPLKSVSAAEVNQIGGYTLDLADSRLVTTNSYYSSFEYVSTIAGVDETDTRAYLHITQTNNAAMQIVFYSFAGLDGMYIEGDKYYVEFIAKSATAGGFHLLGFKGATGTSAVDGGQLNQTAIDSNWVKYYGILTATSDMGSVGIWRAGGPYEMYIKSITVRKHLTIKDGVYFANGAEFVSSTSSSSSVVTLSENQVSGVPAGTYYGLQLSYGQNVKINNFDDLFEVGHYYKVIITGYRTSSSTLYAHMFNGNAGGSSAQLSTSQTTTEGKRQLSTTICVANATNYKSLGLFNGGGTETFYIESIYVSEVFNFTKGDIATVGGTTVDGNRLNFGVAGGYCVYDSGKLHYKQTANGGALKFDSFKNIFTEGVRYRITITFDGSVTKVSTFLILLMNSSGTQVGDASFNISGSVYTAEFTAPANVSYAEIFMANGSNNSDFTIASVNVRDLRYLSGVEIDTAGFGLQTYEDVTYEEKVGSIPAGSYVKVTNGQYQNFVFANWTYYMSTETAYRFEMKIYGDINATNFANNFYFGGIASPTNANSITKGTCVAQDDGGFLVVVEFTTKTTEQRFGTFTTAALEYYIASASLVKVES